MLLTPAAHRVHAAPVLAPGLKPSSLRDERPADDTCARTSLSVGRLLGAGSTCVRACVFLQHLPHALHDSGVQGAPFGNTCFLKKTTEGRKFNVTQKLY